MLRLDQERALVVVAWVQQLEIESLVDPVRRGDRPRAPVSGAGLIEPAVRRPLAVYSRLIPGPCGQPVRSAPARCRTPARLTAPAPAWGRPRLRGLIAQLSQRQPSVSHVSLRPSLVHLASAAVTNRKRADWPRTAVLIGGSAVE